MTQPDPTDLLSLDRDVARAYAAWRAWTRAVAKDPETHADQEPLERWRHVAGQSTYDALGAPAPGAFDAPLRDGLRRWVYTLAQARIARPLDAELARARAARSAQVNVPEPHLASWGEAWQGIVVAPTSTERRAWLGVASERGPAVASIVRRRAERREEVAQRMGLERGDALFAGSPLALASAAESLLDRTEDLARELLHRARRQLELPLDPPLAVDAIHIAVAREAPEGWPARLTSHWLDEVFGRFARGLRLELPPLPAAVGASSFVRACASFGGALRVAGASPSLPFAVARDPEFAAMHRFACVFGALPASAAFQRRVLGNGARVADAQSRVLARSALLHVRLEAARFLLRNTRAPDRFEHLTHRLFGAPLPAPLVGAWPAPDDDAPSRLVGLLTAPALSSELVDRFDVDWFANPRAVLHLRAIASAPAHEGPVEDLAPAVTPLARSFEEALG